MGRDADDACLVLSELTHYRRFGLLHDPVTTP
jgi:hypothetical protein